LRKYFSGVRTAPYCRPSESFERLRCGTIFQDAYLADELPRARGRTVRFALDSPLEGTGFELSVPPDGDAIPGAALLGRTKGDEPLI
jgi:hypothetical protein